ncbi:MAG: hypothetical protein Q9174_007402, partial [Haloplaca sp. 1 TL-2023]
NGIQQQLANPIVKIIYGSRSAFTKTDLYDVWAPTNEGYTGHFPTRDEKTHTERRRNVNNIYSMSCVLESETSIDACTNLLCKNMRIFAEKGSLVDLGLWINMYAYDVIGELFYRKMFGFMHENKDIKGYMHAIDSMVSMFAIGGTLPSYLVRAYFFYTTMTSPLVRRALGDLGLIKTGTKMAIEERKKEPASQKSDNKHDILRKLLELNADRGEELNFTDQDIHLEAITAL